MPWGDGTGPFGIPNWPCRRLYGRGAGYGLSIGFRRCFSWRYGRGYAQPITLTKEEQKKILEEELKEIEAEKEAIEKKLRELKDM